jgi:GxxExxY protein
MDMELKDCPTELTNQVIAAAIEVHKELGPGLLESVYEKALAIELADRGIDAKRQLDVTTTYKGKDLGCGFRADLVIENSLVVELKTVEKISDLHVAQVITYLKFLQFKRGLIMNFNEKLLKNGLKRISI